MGKTFKMFDAKHRPAKKGYFGVKTSTNPFSVNSGTGGNCTWYAYGRFCQAAGKKISMRNYSDAADFYDNFPTCKKGKTPQIGSIVCWGRTSSSRFGHVAFVENVSDTHIWISEDGAFHGWMCGMDPPYHLRKMKRSEVNGRNGMPLRGYIYNPTKFDNVVEVSASELDMGSDAFDIAANNDLNASASAITLKKGIEQLYTSDNYVWATEEKENAFAKAVRNTLSKIFESQKQEPTKDEGFANTFITVMTKDFEKVPKRERFLTRGNLAAYPNLVQAPFIQVSFNGITIGGYNHEEDKYPNHITGLEIDKINGRINQYRISITHQVRAGEDPNFIDSLLSRTGVRNKIQIVYGDSAYGAYFKEDEAYIVNATYSESVQSAQINYTIEAISSMGVLQEAYFNFPATTAKPSTEIIRMLYEDRNTSKELQELLGGMRDKAKTLAKGLIPTDDDEVFIPGVQDGTLSDRLVQLASYMKDSSTPTASYFLSFEDDKDGAFFKISKVDKVNNVNQAIMKNCYYVDVGYPGNAFVTDFSLNSDVYWPLYYKYSDSIATYNYDIDYTGQLIATKVNPLTISDRYNTIDLTKMNWWNFVQNYPVSATLTIKGLMKPIQLIENIYVYAQFYGKEDLSSGLYSIIGQHDSINGSGYTTTLELLRVQN